MVLVSRQERHPTPSEQSGQGHRAPDPEEHAAEVTPALARKHLTSSLLGQEPVSQQGLHRAAWLEEVSCSKKL